MKNDDKLKKSIKGIFDEYKVPKELPEVILSDIRHRIYIKNIRNISITIAASILFFIIFFFLFIPRNIEITENKKIENVIKIVKKKEVINKGNIAIKRTEDIKENEFYVVFPKEDDIFEENRSIVFYVKGDIKEIKYEIDGEEFSYNISNDEETIVIPFTPVEGVHLLRVIYPIETEILFYSLGEG